MSRAGCSTPSLPSRPPPTRTTKEAQAVLENTSGAPSVGRRARLVAFTSRADNLVPRDSNWASDVFVRATSRGDRTGATPPGITASWNPHSPCTPPHRRVQCSTTTSGTTGGSPRTGTTRTWWACSASSSHVGWMHWHWTRGRAAAAVMLVSRSGAVRMAPCESDSPVQKQGGELAITDGESPVTESGVALQRRCRSDVIRQSPLARGCLRCLTRSRYACSTGSPDIRGSDGARCRCGGDTVPGRCRARRGLRDHRRRCLHPPRRRHRPGDRPLRQRCE